MNYEKAYNEALERAKEFHKSKEGIYVLAAETIFPELRESEDERIRKELIEFILWVEDRGLTRQDFYQGKRPGVWLAWLQKQKEQKPVEWSEEDGHAIENCEYAIKETFKDEQNPHRIGTLNWLKSLRPSWKPAEEQMEALDKAIPVCMGVAGRKEVAPLESLYNDLKKLI